MMANDPLEASRNEAFRRLGRNIALFQALERLLKALTASSLIEGPPAEIEACAAKRQADLADKTLGQVLSRYKEDVLADPPDLEDERAPWVRISYRLEGDEYRKLRAAQLKQLAAERNRLAHCLHEDYDLHTAEGILQLTAFLEPQAERIRQEIWTLKRQLADWDEMRAAAAMRLAAMLD